MRSINCKLVIGIAVASVGFLIIVVNGLLLSKQKASHYQPEKKFLAPTDLPTFIPTPTLAPGQIKAIYTFYIQATSHKINSKGLGLNPSDSGKTFVVDIGTLIILRNFGMGRFYISQSSPQNIFTNPNPGKLPGSVPVNAIEDFGVFRSGYGTITVTEAN